MRLMAAKLTDTDFYGQIRTALAAKRLAGVCVAAGAAVVGARCGNAVDGGNTVNNGEFLPPSG